MLSAITIQALASLCNSCSFNCSYNVWYSPALCASNVLQMLQMCAYRFQLTRFSPCFPQVYKYKDAFAGGQIKVEVYISFGGLLMLLVGDPKKLQDLEVDSSVYLLVRKV